VNPHLLNTGNVQGRRLQKGGYKKGYNEKTPREDREAQFSTTRRIAKPVYIVK
jgi:hypothetical protein